MGNSHASSPAPLRLIEPPPPTNQLSPQKLRKLCIEY